MCECVWCGTVESLDAQFAVVNGELVGSGMRVVLDRVGRETLTFHFVPF